MFTWSFSNLRCITDSKDECWVIFVDYCLLFTFFIWTRVRCTSSHCSRLRITLLTRLTSLFLWTTFSPTFIFLLLLWHSKNSILFSFQFFNVYFVPIRELARFNFLGQSFTLFIRIWNRFLLDLIKLLLSFPNLDLINRSEASTKMRYLLFYLFDDRLLVTHVFIHQSTCVEAYSCFRLAA